MVIDKWKVVQGKSPTKRELSTWPAAKFIVFIQFCLFFVVYEGDTSKISVTKERWRNAEQFLEDPEHPFQEFLYRINFFTFDASSSEKKFYFKLISMMKFILGYLRNNPGIISDEMRKLIEPHPRLNWCLTNTKIVETAIGPVIARDSSEPLGPVHTKTEVVTYDKQMLDAMSKVINIFHMLAGSITPKELEKMDTKDKLLALARLLPSLTIGKNFKPGKQVFKQLVINKASREDLESAVLNFNSNDE